MHISEGEVIIFPQENGTRFSVGDCARFEKNAIEDGIDILELIELFSDLKDVCEYASLMFL